MTLLWTCIKHLTDWLMELPTRGRAGTRGDGPMGGTKIAAPDTRTLAPWYRPIVEQLVCVNRGCFMVALEVARALSWDGPEARNDMRAAGRVAAGLMLVDMVISCSRSSLGMRAAPLLLLAVVV